MTVVMSGEPVSFARRLTALLREQERMLAAADGWIARTPQHWRDDWRARMAALIADVRAHDEAPIEEDAR